MSRVEEAKDGLKNAINRLQKIIQSRIDELEIENSTLRTQIVQLKQEVLTLKRSKSEVESSSKQANLLSDEELTLNELKKIVG